MAQQNEQNHSFDPATVPVKRKRGRPRKEDVPGAEPSGRTQRRRRNAPPTAGPGLVGQPVSGMLDGVFDAGFLITVQVGNSGPLLRGMVFDSRLSVPISAANDVAPHIKMSKREEIPIPAPTPAEPLQRGGPSVPSPLADKGGPKDGSQGSALKSKISEALLSAARSTFPKEVTQMTVQVLDYQRQGLTGELKLDSTSKAPQGNETASDLKLDSTNEASQGNEAAGELKLGSTSQTGNDAGAERKLDSTIKVSQGNETAGGLKLRLTSQTAPGNEASGKASQGNETPCQLKLDCEKQTTLVSKATGEQNVPGNEVAGEPMVLWESQTTLGTEAADKLKVDCVSEIPTDNETASELEQCSTEQTPPANETASVPPVNTTVEGPMLESTSQISSEPHVPGPTSELDSKTAEFQNDAD